MSTKLTTTFLFENAADLLTEYGFDENGINCDDTNADDLLVVADIIGLRTEVAAELLGRPLTQEVDTALMDLRQYILDLEYSHWHRLAGRVAAAKRWAKRADETYAQLPSYLRW